MSWGMRQEATMLHRRLVLQKGELPKVKSCLISVGNSGSDPFSEQLLLLLEDTEELYWRTNYILIRNRLNLGSCCSVRICITIRAQSKLFKRQPTFLLETAWIKEVVLSSSPQSNSCYPHSNQIYWRASTLEGAYIGHISSEDKGKGYWCLLLTFEHWMSFARYKIPPWISCN